MTRSTVLGLGLALVSIGLASAQEARTATSIARTTAAACAAPDCRTLWSRALGAGWRAAIRRTNEDGGRETLIALVLTRRDRSWTHEIDRSGLRCGGTSEFSHVASFRHAALHDFADGPLPEIFVDYAVSVIGDEGPAVHQDEMVLCSVEGAAGPSCLGYVGGVAPSFPTRGRLAFGPTAFDVVFP